MEHLSSVEELEIMSTMDFIVPLKQVGIISRSVLEAIREFYQPRRIIVVTKSIEGDILNKLLPFWNVGPVECLDESIFFVKNFGLSFEDIIAEYDATRPGDQREPGWWIQQLIKLGAATQIEDISPTYVVWDGDLVPSRRWKLCSRDATTGRLKYHIAILQGESRSEFNTTQYANCMRALTGFTPLEPVEGGTFVAHHMVFQTKYVTEMLALMAERTACLDPWPVMIMASSRKFYRFSEYKTYATFMLKTHPDEFHYHELSMFGEGGLRFREANTIVDDMLTVSKIKDGGLSFDQVRGYVTNNWKALTAPGQCMPAYIQLDHVYGLAGFELNMSPYPPTPSVATTFSSFASSFPSSFSSSFPSSFATSFPSSFSFASPIAAPSSSSSSFFASSSCPHTGGTSYPSDIDSIDSPTGHDDTHPDTHPAACPLSVSLPVPPTPSPAPVPVAVRSFVHYMFPTKRPRFIVQR